MTDFEDAPRISLGGKDWAIPMLAAKQNRIIDPLILSLLPLFAEWSSNKMLTLQKVGAKEYDALLDIAYHATKRAYPENKKEEFLDLPITLPELILAFSVIAQQTGVFKRGEPGEAKGVATPPIGTE